MRKIFSWFLTLILIMTSSTMVVSCWIETPFGPITTITYDQDNNPLTDVGSDNAQWADYLAFATALFILSKEIFPTSQSFQQNLSHKSSNEIINNYFRDSEGERLESNYHFNYDFTFFITTYSQIDKTTIQAMKTTELSNQPNNLYLFLNLPKIDLDQIQTEPEITFQLIYLMKNLDGSLTGNKYNSWYYWKQWKISNVKLGEGGINDEINPNTNEPYNYFFNIKSDELKITQHVITNYIN